MILKIYVHDHGSCGSGCRFHTEMRRNYEPGKQNNASYGDFQRWFPLTFFFFLFFLVLIFGEMFPSLDVDWLPEKLTDLAGTRLDSMIVAWLGWGSLGWVLGLVIVIHITHPPCLRNYFDAYWKNNLDLQRCDLIHDDLLAFLGWYFTVQWNQWRTLD